MKKHTSKKNIKKNTAKKDMQKNLENRALSFRMPL
jgi:hypothetical protein